MNQVLSLMVAHLPDSPTRSVGPYFAGEATVGEGGSISPQGYPDGRVKTGAYT